MATPAIKRTPNPSSDMACIGATMRALAASTDSIAFQMAGADPLLM